MEQNSQFKPIALRKAKIVYNLAFLSAIVLIMEHGTASSADQLMRIGQNGTKSTS